MRTGREHTDGPGVAAGQRTGAEPGNQSSPNHRGLTAAGRAENGKKACRFQLLDQTLDVAVAAEKEFDMFFVEGLQTTIGTDVSSRFDGSFRTWSNAFDGINQKLKAAR